MALCALSSEVLALSGPVSESVKVPTPMTHLPSL